VPARRLGIFSATRNVAIFLLALAATSAALTAFAPFPKLGNLWRKYHHLRDHRADYSVIYLGSSRVFHEFIPEQFDAALAARGHHLRSFNFGQDGMWPPESFYMLRQILAMKPPQLKWVLIDLMGIKSEIDGNESTLRSVYWHDLRHTWIAWRHALKVNMLGQRTAREKAEAVWRHAQLWGQHATGLGQGHEKLEILLKLTDEKKPRPIVAGGFEAGGQGPLRDEMLEDFTRAVNRLKTNPPPKPIQPVLRDALKQVIEDVRAAGAEPIFVVAANIFGAERYNNWPPAGVHVLRFDDPNQYSDLYDPAHRYDSHHLDAAGAQAFTRHLAEQFAGVLERKQ
jgi:hypothetical protein